MATIPKELEELIPRPRTTPAAAEGESLLVDSQAQKESLTSLVYREVRLRILLLAEVRRLVREDSEDRLLICDPDYLDYLCEIYMLSSLEGKFRLDTMDSPEQVMEETQKTRNWLLQTIKIQEVVLDKPKITRLLRSSLEKEKNERSDLETLYTLLTDTDEDDPQARLDLAFMMALHFDYPEKHKDTFEKLKQHADRLSKLSDPIEEALRRRIVEKARSVKVDMFACAVPLSPIVSSGDQDEHECPICRNSYHDFANFAIEDLVADYPVRIKYCGHVVGKSCLEMWMKTPLADAARFPNRTCPLCRTDIEGVVDPPAPEELWSHIENNPRVIKLIQSTGLDPEECVFAVQRLMSEQLALFELLNELVDRMETEGGEGDAIAKARTFLKRQLRKLGPEKTMWGFGRQEEKWEGLRKQWMDTSIASG